MEEQRVEHSIEVEPIMIKDVEPIRKNRSTMIQNSEHLKELIEKPLLPACEVLYQKNIQTLESSANAEDIKYRGNARIAIDWNSLSAENRIIARNMGLEPISYDRTRSISIQTLIDEAMTISQISDKMKEIVQPFVEQEPTWIPKYSIDDLRGLYRKEDEVGPEYFIAAGYFYDLQTQTFYESEDHYQKVKAWEEQSQKD